MSLLMDALRRAEQEKKQQQSRAARDDGSDALDDDSVTPAPLPQLGPDDITLQIDPVALARAAAAQDIRIELDDEAGVPSRAFDLADDGDRSRSLALGSLTLEPLEVYTLDRAAFRNVIQMDESFKEQLYKIYYQRR